MSWCVHVYVQERGEISCSRNKGQSPEMMVRLKRNADPEQQFRWYGMTEFRQFGELQWGLRVRPHINLDFSGTIVH